MKIESFAVSKEKTQAGAIAHIPLYRFGSKKPQVKIEMMADTAIELAATIHKMFGYKLLEKKK